ncbi:hypothetical protein H9Q74_007492 [Fusarium xylarioides]|nr:hypothetical protein H9Q71_007707 [Fusarium xylarioides]KAG5822422.1 hypothetical protein H9Q74_007492 [Fusarium xylarioides]
MGKKKCKNGAGKGKKMDWDWVIARWDQLWKSPKLKAVRLTNPSLVVFRPQSQTAKRGKRKQDILSLDEDDDAFVPDAALMLEFDLAMSNDQNESNPSDDSQTP